MAKTIDYYVEGGGSVECWVVDYGGSGAVPLLTVDTVIEWIEMLGYTVNATGNITSAQVQLCLDSVTADITDAANQFALLRLFATNTSKKNEKTLKGAVALTLSVLRNKGANRGLTSDMIIISNETADKFQAEYDKAIDDLTNGRNIGA